MIAWLAGGATLLIAVLPPLAYYSAARSRLIGALEASAHEYALVVAETARQSPEYWNALAGDSVGADFDNLSISEALPPERAIQGRRVTNMADRTVIEVAASPELRWPVVASDAPVMNGATHLGAVKVTRSLRPELRTTLVVALASGLLAGAVFVILRVLPLRLLKQALERSAYLSAYDQLTGLPNRHLFADRLTQALASAHRGHQRIGVLCLDLDRFKQVNDTLGHGAGDLLLRIVSGRLQSCLRETDTLARLGGDEFAVILPDVHDPTFAGSLAQRLIEALRPPVELESFSATVGVSIGFAISEPTNRCGTEQMLRDADVAMYQAKDAGRGRFCFFAPEMNTRLLERQTMENELRIAVADRTLFLHFQPQVDLMTGAVTGAEALLRWNRRGHGMVPPDRFIALAEETGLISEIGDFALRAACAEATNWPDVVRVGVNVSPVQFRLPDFYQSVADVLAETGLSPDRLEIEITEGVLMNDTNETLATLDKLRDLGVRLAMDDFGTGYSSLGYLQKFRFDKIKIDKSFVQRLGEDPNAAAIVRAVVGLSEALQVCTNAEGVETALQADLLRVERCREVQGYLYGRPMSATAFRATLVGNHVVA